MIGRVVSIKMAKTAAVLVERTAIHPLYKKVFKRSKKYLADDLVGVKDGDLVEIVKVAPVSKNKHWRILKVVGKNLEEITEEKLKAEAKEIVAEVMPEEKKSEQGTVESGQPEEETKRSIKRIKKGEKK